MLAIHPGAQGRFEHIDCGLPCDLILDTASSPAAVEQFLTAVRAGMDPEARLHAVLGVMGGPDPAHRRALGRVARSLSDRLVLTAGSFRRNPPLGPLEGLIAGASGTDGADLEVITDREEALADAVHSAEPGDVIAVMGRGNVIESIHGGKAEDRETLRRIARGDRGAGPEGAGEAPERELGLKLE